MNIHAAQLAIDKISITYLLKYANMIPPMATGQ